MSNSITYGSLYFKRKIQEDNFIEMKILKYQYSLGSLISLKKYTRFIV